ncbi:MAG: hypothetical protein K0R75_1200 [Paenibacillaceae bacterium]|jgi:catechol 2,3-dioxygenase-like lactoylglutathione lyase family enzyme|nr:hypothetical protein [Paenibacillaceae bacterium]
MVGSGIVLDRNRYAPEHLYKVPPLHFNTNNIYEAYEYMISKGVEVTTGIEQNRCTNGSVSVEVDKETNRHYQQERLKMNKTTDLKNLVHAVVQVRLPVRDINESVEWYEKYFGFTHNWKTEEESDLGLEPGPFLFLIRVDQPTPIQIVSHGKPYAVLSIKTSNVFECYRRFVEAGEEVTEITFPEFNVTDPSGNVIHIANYPDLHIAGF